MNEFNVILKPAEKLFLWRRAEKMAQLDLARKLKVHQTTISKMEKGLIPLSDRVAAMIANVKVTEGAAATVLRRRWKLTLVAVAVDTGIHEHRLSEMERGIHEMSEEYRAFLRSRLSAEK